MKTKQTKKNKGIPEGWKNMRLDDVCNVNQGLQIPISERYKEKNKDRKVYITTRYLHGKNQAEYIEDFSNSVVCSKKDILMTRTGNSGIVISGAEGVFHNNFFKVKPNKLIDRKLLIYNLKSPFIQYKLLKLAGASTIPDLNHGDFYSISLLLPPLPEQKRIVGVLGVWDGYLEKLKRKIEIKKEIKKWLMQNLLTGKIRVGGFDEDWKEFKLNSLGKTYQGITGKTKEDFGEGEPFISYMNIYSNSKININNVNTFVKLINGENQNKVKYGDLFFTTSSETPNEVGISSVLLYKNNSNLYLNSFCFGFRLDNFKTLIPEFSQFYFRGQNFRKKMTRIAQGASRFNLSKRYFLDTKINISIDTREQKAIADILMGADREIEELEKKEGLIKEQKKYLLNNLVSGEIRTPVNLKIN